MKQSGQIEIRQNSVIKSGSVVRLLQPFRPDRCSYQKYTWAIVAGIVTNSLSSRRFQPSYNYQQTTSGYQPGWREVIVYLYEPQSSTVYLDRCGTQALFSFNSDEVELDFSTSDC